MYIDPKDTANVPTAIRRTSVIYKKEDPIWREYDAKIKETTQELNNKLKTMKGPHGYIYPTAIWALLNVEYKRVLLSAYRSYAASGDIKQRLDVIRVRSASRVPQWFENKHSKEVLEIAWLATLEIIKMTDEPGF